MQEQFKSHKTVEQIARKHRLDISFIKSQLKMGEKIEHEHTRDHELAKEIALQHLDEIPDYYTKLKKMEANAKKSIKEGTKSGDEGLHDWFNKSKSSDGKKGWVQLGGKFAGKPCARQPGQTSTPKCGSSKMAANLSSEEEETARRRKNRLDPNQPQKTGGAKPTNVRTEEMNLQEVKDKPGKSSGKKDACYNKVKSRYDVWPSAYASGALVKCRKVGAANWGTKSEECWTGYRQEGMKKKGKKVVPNCVPVKEEKSMVKYCTLCKKNETKSECSFGPSLWEKYSIARVHPTNEENAMNEALRSREERMARMATPKTKKEQEKKRALRSKAEEILSDMQALEKGKDKKRPTSTFKTPEAEVRKLKPGQKKDTLAVKASKVMKEQSNLMKFNEYGQTYVIRFTWRGLMYKVQIFIPSLKKPSAQEIKTQLNKIYPGAMLLQFEPKENDPVDPTIVFSKEDLDINEVAAWQRKEGKSESGGLNEKGRKSYERENPGSDLKAPSKKVGNPRREFFCDRMSGMKRKLTSKKTANDPNSRINKSLRAWNC